MTNCDIAGVIWGTVRKKFEGLLGQFEGLVVIWRTFGQFERLMAIWVIVSAISGTVMAIRGTRTAIPKTVGAIWETTGVILGTVRAIWGTVIAICFNCCNSSDWTRHIYTLTYISHLPDGYIDLNILPVFVSSIPLFWYITRRYFDDLKCDPFGSNNKPGMTFQVKLEIHFSTVKNCFRRVYCAFWLCRLMILPFNRLTAYEICRDCFQCSLTLSVTWSHCEALWRILCKTYCKQWHWTKWRQQIKISCTC